MLDLRKLRLLRDLAARGTIAAVAESLAYTPSAVSQQLSALEREAGTPLLERVGRRLRLTDAGQALVEHTEELLARLEEAEAELQRAGGAVRGTVRLSAFQTASIGLLPGLLRELAARHPAVRLEYTEGLPDETLPALALGELDIVVAEEYEHHLRPRYARLVYEPLMEDRILVALPAGHPLDGDGPVALKALEHERWAVPRPETAFAGAVMHACRTHGGFDPDIRHRSNDIRVILALVDSGEAVALASELGTPADRRLHEVAGQPLRRSVFVAHRRSAEQRPAVAAVRDVLREVSRTDRSPGPDGTVQGPPRAPARPAAGAAVPGASSGPDR